MTRPILLLILAALAAQPAAAHHHRHDGPTALFAGLTGAEPETAERLCRGPGGRAVRCPLPGQPLR